MTRRELIHKLAAHKEELRRMGMTPLVVFGSNVSTEEGEVNNKV